MIICVLISVILTAIKRLVLPVVPAPQAQCLREGNVFHCQAVTAWMMIDLSRSDFVYVFLLS